MMKQRLAAVTLASTVLMLSATESSAANYAIGSGSNPFDPEYTYQASPQGAYDPNGPYTTITVTGPTDIFSEWLKSGRKRRRGGLVFAADSAGGNQSYMLAASLNDLLAKIDNGAAGSWTPPEGISNPQLGAFLDGLLLTPPNPADHTGSAPRLYFVIKDLGTHLFGTSYGPDRVTPAAASAESPATSTSAAPLAAPGPIAGAGLPALLALAGILLMRRRTLA